MIRILCQRLAVCAALLLTSSRVHAEPETVPEADDEEGSPSMRLTGDVTMEFSYAKSGEQTLNAFELRRAELGLRRLGVHDVGGEILVEAIRSAGANSFAGIDGDSLLLRLRRAWGYGRWRPGALHLEARAGLVPTPWLESAEEESQLRFVERLTAVRLGVYPNADLGTVGKLSVLGGQLELQVGVFNGEGANLPEQNNGKNLQAMLTGILWRRAILDEELSLRLRAGGQEGSIGPSASANHRLSAGLSAVHPRLAAGLEVHRGYGYQAVSSRDSQTIGAWLRAGHRGFSLVIRYDHAREDVDRPQTNRHLFLAGLFAERAARDILLRIGLVARQETSDQNASPVPGLISAGRVRAALVVFNASFGGE